jgi:4-hydroxybenzoate polyprenyltransferase
VLGLSLGIAPVGATIAVLGEITPESIVLAIGVMCWSAGFDIIYALQDAEFDRQRGLRSIPSRFSARNSLIISALLHVVSISFIVLYTTYQPQSWLAWLGCVMFALIVASEHILVTPTKQRNIGIAFGTFNALASVAYGVALILNLLIFS